MRFVWFSIKTLDISAYFENNFSFVKVNGKVIKILLSKLLKTIKYLLSVKSVKWNWFLTNDFIADIYSLGSVTYYPIFATFELCAHSFFYNTFF